MSPTNINPFIFVCDTETDLMKFSATRPVPRSSFWEWGKISTMATHFTISEREKQEKGKKPKPKPKPLLLIQSMLTQSPPAMPGTMVAPDLAHIACGRGSRGSYPVPGPLSRTGLIHLPSFREWCVDGEESERTKMPKCAGLELLPGVGVALASTILVIRSIKIYPVCGDN